MLTIISCVVAVVMRDHTVVLVIWLLAAVLTAALCGYVLTSLGIVAHMAKTARLFGETAEPVERMALLARLDERLAAYPHLWPRSAPIVAAVVVVIGGALVALIGS